MEWSGVEWSGRHTRAPAAAAPSRGRRYRHVAVRLAWRTPAGRAPPPASRRRVNNGGGHRRVIIHVFEPHTHGGPTRQPPSLGAPPRGLLPPPAPSGGGQHGRRRACGRRASGPGACTHPLARWIRPKRESERSHADEMSHAESRRVIFSGENVGASWGSVRLNLRLKREEMGPEMGPEILPSFGEEEGKRL